MLKPKTVATCLFFIGIIFLLGGGLDFLSALIGGEQNAGFMAQPKMTGLTPAVIMLYIFGFLGMLFIHWGGTNLATKEKLAQKQIMAGVIIVMVVYVLLMLVYGIGNDNWRRF